MNKVRNISNLIDDDQNILFTAEDKVNELANTFAETHKITSDFHHSIDRKVNKFNYDLDLNNDLNLNESSFTSPVEIKLILESLKSSKSPGLDTIQNKILKKIPFKLIIL